MRRGVAAVSAGLRCGEVAGRPGGQLVPPVIGCAACEVAGGERGGFVAAAVDEEAFGA
jgi:hypothetical protein